MLDVTVADNVVRNAVFPAEELSALGVLGAVDNVCNNGAGCGKLACTSAVEYYVADSVASDENGVENIVNACKLAVALDEGGRNHCAYLAVAVACGSADKLDYAAPGFCVFNVCKGNFCNSLGVDLVGINVIAEAERSKNTNLSAGVLTLNVGAGVTLCVAELLSNFESVLKAHTVVNHLGEDEVCGAVENTRNFVYFVCGKALADGADNRDAAADTCFKQEVDVLFLGNLEKLIALCGNKLLVGGDNALACLEAVENEIVSGVNAAHCFNNNAYCFIAQNVLEILGEKSLVLVTGEITKVENTCDLHFILHTAFCDARIVLFEDLGNARTDNAVAHNCYIHILSSEGVIFRNL